MINYLIIFNSSLVFDFLGWNKEESVIWLPLHAQLISRFRAMNAVRVISSALSVFCQHCGKTNALINMLIISSATLNIVLYILAATALAECDVVTVIYPVGIMTRESN
jgi:hypothetical protein